MPGSLQREPEGTAPLPRTGRLHGSHAVIAGAAGGIGSAAARVFVREGAVVGLLDLPGSRLDSLAADLGDAATPLPADLTEEASVAAAFRAWWDQRGHLTILYVCSGIQLHGEDGPVHAVSLQTWQSTYSVNATGTFLACKYGLPQIQRSGGGSVLLCGSPTAVTMSGSGYTAYASSKGAVMSLSRIIAADYAADDIRCNVIVPGAVRTPLIKDLLADERILSNLEQGTPLRRLSEPADLTGIAVFLASPESSYATGAVFTVDGGVTAR